MTRMLY